MPRQRRRLVSGTAERYLESKEDDRLQTAIVALSFLSTDHVECAQVRGLAQFFSIIIGGFLGGSVLSYQIIASLSGAFGASFVC